MHGIDSKDYVLKIVGPGICVKSMSTSQKSSAA